MSAPFDRFVSLLAYALAPLARYVASFSGWVGKKGVATGKSMALGSSRRRDFHFSVKHVYQDLMGIGPSLREFCQQEDDSIPNEDRDHTPPRR